MQRTRSLQWILANVTHSVDGFHFSMDAEEWHRMIVKKSDDSVFDCLVDAIVEKGFKYPICLVPNDDGTWTLGNGHHRLSAALLLGLDEVIVWESDDRGRFMCETQTNGKCPGLGSRDYVDMLNLPGEYRYTWDYDACDGKCYQKTQDSTENWCWC